MRTTYVQAAMLEHVERELDATRLKLAAAEAERDRLARLLNPPTQGGQYPTPEDV